MDRRRRIAAVGIALALGAWAGPGRAGDDAAPGTTGTAVRAGEEEEPRGGGESADAGEEEEPRGGGESADAGEEEEPRGGGESADAGEVAEARLQQRSFELFFERCGVDPDGFDGRMVATHWNVLLGLGWTPREIHDAAAALPEDCTFVSFRGAILATARPGDGDDRVDGGDGGDDDQGRRAGERRSGDERRGQPRPRGPRRR